jgi:hypothetical protein
MPVDLNQPQIMAAIIGGSVAAIVSLAVALINQISLRGMHEEKLNADRELAEQKFRFDMKFASSKRRTEVAEPTLADFYKARDTISWARSPDAPGNEGATRVRAGNETEEQARHLDSLYVPIERLHKNNELFSRLSASRYRFQASFGVRAIEPFEKLEEIQIEIMAAAYSLINEARRNRVGSMHDHWKTIIWKNLEEEDSIASRVAAAVADMEAICRPILGQAEQHL